MANTSKQATKSIAVKGSTMTVLTILARSADIEGLGKGLDEITGGAPDFFDYDAAVIDFSTAGDLSAVVPPDWAVLRQTFLRCHLNLVAVRAAPSEWRKSTMQAGLTWVKESETVRTEEKSAKKNVSDQSGKTAAAQAKSVDDDRPAKATRKKEAEKSVEKPMEAQAPAEAEKRTVKTMILDKPLRSGQRVYAPGDLIIIAAVHPGSEVIADGNINVYAPLRGRALAGARGDETARILSTCFEAELVSIAGVYLTFEPGTPAEVFGKPAQVRLDAGEKGKTILHVQPLGS